MHRKESIFMQRIARMLQKELGDMFLRESKYLVPGALISVTAVQVSADISVAKVYLSIIGNVDHDKAIQLISRRVRVLRTQLAQRVRNKLKNTPRLKLFLDDSAAHATKIEHLLRSHATNA